MSILYLSESHNSFVDNLSSLFFNYLSNNYYNDTLNISSTTYNIYHKILSCLNKNIQINKHISNSDFKIHLNKHIYNLLNNNINTYIDINIKNKQFLNELFTNNEFQYYTNKSNEILRLLSDNNTNYSETFNISKNYNLYKTKFLNDKKTERYNDLKKKTIKTLKNKLYEIYIVINGLEKIMYSNYNNLLEYENKTFSEMMNIIKNMYGSTHLNFNNIDTIYFLYSQKTIDYYDIYNDILTYPSLKDKIVKLFIQLNYLKFNEKINNLNLYKQYKHILTKVYDKFLYDKEQDEDDEIESLTPQQKDIILNYSIKHLYNKFKKSLYDNFSNKYSIDKQSYNYKNIYNDIITISLRQIPIDFINNIDLSSFKQEVSNNESNSVISNKDIIKDIIPNIQKISKINTQKYKHKNIINEAENRLKFIESNKEDVDYMNHTINFFSDNFEDDENLSKLKESISFLDFEFINHFNINILRVKSMSNSRSDTKLISNIINDIVDDDDDIDYKNTNTYIIDDYHQLSPVYETNFEITLNNTKYTFKTLLHFIYFNQYLELYKIYYMYSNHTELKIIDINTLAYNLIFKGSKLNIFEESKSIISNKINFKNFSELQTTYYELLNNIKYFIFKLEMNNKINNAKIPYFNFILSYANDMNIKYADREDNYLGIGKYGNGDNMVGIFLNEYKSYVNNNNVFDYDYKHIFLIMCNFNQNVLNWFELKLTDLLHTIVNCCMLSSRFDIDTVTIDNIVENFYSQYNTYDSIYYLPIHNSFKEYIDTELNNILTKVYLNFNNINITENAISDIWKICHKFINNIFSFQRDIIDNSDDFQTFINYYDKYNIEHLLYYTLSLHEFDDLYKAIENYTTIKIDQLKSFYSSDNINYNNFALSILFNDNIDTENYSYIVNKYNDSLNFNIDNNTKHINIIKSKLSFYQ